MLSNTIAMKRFLKFSKRFLLFLLLVCILAITYIRCTRLTDEVMYEMNDVTYDVYTTGLNHEEFFYEVEGDVTLHAVLFKPDSIIPIGTIIHFPGGGMHIPTSEQSYTPFLEKGFQIFNYERRSLGQSTGVGNNSKVLLEDALYVFDQLVQNPQIKNTPIILWGQSMGGPYATSVAAANQDIIRGLVLEGTFSSFPDIGKEFAHILHLERFSWIVPFIMNNDFPVEEVIKKITKPTIIIHSTKDETVPYELGEKIYKASNKENTEFWTVDSKHIGALYKYESVYLSKFEKLINNRN